MASRKPIVRLSLTTSAAEGVAIRNISEEEVRLIDYALTDPATGDWLALPDVVLEPGKVFVVARAGVGSAATVEGLEALMGIDAVAWVGEYTVWPSANLPALADGGGSLALVNTDGGMRIEDNLEWGVELIAENAYNTSQPVSLNRQVYQLAAAGTYSGFDAAELAVSAAEWWATVAGMINPGPSPVLQAAAGTRRVGGKRYEFTDHLGNVRAVISDIRRASISGNVVSFATDVKSFTDYYAFGWAMPGRTFSAGEYRYGFNGQENSPEIDPGHTTALFWEYDSKLGRRWNMDPVAVANESPFAVNRNNPISNNDPNGDFPDPPTTTYRVNFGMSIGTAGTKFFVSAFAEQRWAIQPINGNVKPDPFCITPYVGAGLTYHQNLWNTGKSVLELRTSQMMTFGNSQYNASLASNQWNGGGFKQRTGMFKLNVGKFSAFYENDGGYLDKICNLGDGGDSYRTAALGAGWGNWNLRVNLFTGKRDQKSYAIERKRAAYEGVEGGRPDPLSGIGTFGEKYQHGFVHEQGPKYRYGGLTMNYNGPLGDFYEGSNSPYANFSVGIDSDRWVRHNVQNRFAHNFASPQEQFPVQRGITKIVANVSTAGVTRSTTWAQGEND